MPELAILLMNAASGLGLLAESGEDLAEAREPAAERTSFALRWEPMPESGMAKSIWWWWLDRERAAPADLYAQQGGQGDG